MTIHPTQPVSRGADHRFVWSVRPCAQRKWQTTEKRSSAPLFVLLPIVFSSFAAAATFNKDVLPILQKHCQSCHRPGQLAPMSLLGYTEARPWAKAIKAAVVTQK